MLFLCPVSRFHVAIYNVIPSPCPSFVVPALIRPTLYPYPLIIAPRIYNDIQQTKYLRFVARIPSKFPVVCVRYVSPYPLYSRGTVVSCRFRTVKRSFYYYNALILNDLRRNTGRGGGLARLLPVWCKCPIFLKKFFFESRFFFFGSLLFLP